MAKAPKTTDIQLEEPEQKLPTRDVGPATGNQNKEMVDRRNSIADAADIVRANEFSDVDEPVIPDDTQVDDVPRETHAENEDEVDDKTQTIDSTKKFKVPVLGKMVEMTEDQLIATAAKVESADEYLRLASESVKKSATTALSTDETVSEEVDFRALAKALQVGTEEEAEQALRNLVEKTAKPSKTPDVSQVVRSELSLRDEQAKFEDEFKDVLADNNLRKLVFDRDAELSQTDKETPYTERWRKAAREVRDWAKGFKTLPTDKATRKAQSSPPPSPASTKQTTATDDEGPDDQAYIQQLAEKRGLGRAIRH